MKNSLRKPRIPHVRESVEVCDVKDTKDGIQTEYSKDAINPIRPGLLAQTWGPGGGCITPPH